MVVEFELDALELRCLSVQHYLTWMVAVEASLLDFVKGSSAPTKTYFMASQLHRRLLELCVTRMKLRTDESTESSAEMIITRTPEARMPLLSYYDYIPTPLPNSVFNRLFERIIDVNKKEDLPTPSASDFLLGYYKTLECGFALASHAHLVYVTFTHKDGITELEEFIKSQGFGGTPRLNYRWLDYKVRDKAIIVMRSVAEATELFEMYEEEDSGSDSELHFVLRPVGSAITAPYIEDTQLRKLRVSHWGSILAQWQSFNCDSLTIMAFNMNEKFTIQDLEKSFEGIAVCSITIVAEGLRHTRRVAYVALADSNAVRAALDRDGRNVHGKALRIQMIPPTYDHRRHGTMISSKTITAPPPPPSPAVESQTTVVLTKSPAYNALAKPYTPKPSPPPSPMIVVAPLTGATLSTPTQKWVPNPLTQPFQPKLTPTS